MKQHIYKELSQAESDLKLFSKMNMYEGKFLYLISVPDGNVIQWQKPLYPEHILSIAINGNVFDRKD